MSTPGASAAKPQRVPTALLLWPVPTTRLPDLRDMSPKKTQSGEERWRMRVVVVGDSTATTASALYSTRHWFGGRFRVRRSGIQRGGSQTLHFDRIKAHLRKQTQPTDPIDPRKARMYMVDTFIKMDDHQRPAIQVIKKCVTGLTPVVIKKAEATVILNQQ